MTWWVWVLLGLLIGLLELAVPGYIFLGFAIGAVLTGLFVWLGLLSTHLVSSLVVFSVLSLIAWIAMRKLLGPQAGQVKIITRDINEP